MENSLCSWHILMKVSMFILCKSRPRMSFFERLILSSPWMLRIVLRASGVIYFICLLSINGSKISMKYLSAPIDSHNLMRSLKMNSEQSRTNKNSVIVEIRITHNSSLFYSLRMLATSSMYRRDLLWKMNELLKYWTTFNVHSFDE